MSKDLNQSLIKGIRVLEAMFEDGFHARTVAEIASRAELPHTTTWRLLKTLEARGWVVEIPSAASSQHRWELSADPLARIAHRYQEHALNQIHAIKNQFHDITGKELNA